MVLCKRCPSLALASGLLEVSFTGVAFSFCLKLPPGIHCLLPAWLFSATHNNNRLSIATSLSQLLLAQAMSMNGCVWQSATTGIHWKHSLGVCLLVQVISVKSLGGQWSACAIQSYSKSCSNADTCKALELVEYSNDMSIAMHARALSGIVQGSSQHFAHSRQSDRGSVECLAMILARRQCGCCLAQRALLRRASSRRGLWWEAA